uniref:HNH endonuclease n=1 Tax=Marseillevirus LCMAC101 TaxID=2506602 RepID=A0A481YQU0_9VIRU|nr:MAG: HNH endonuclease [Marseillevirus LCMAC101]
MWFSLQGKKRNTSIHQLVAENYQKNSLNKKQVNHKNGEKGDNRLENLEWNTPSENIQHAHDACLNKGSLTEAAKDCGGNKGSYISNACSGICKKAYGFEWRCAD